MARTPLLRAFERLAEEHRTAEKLGIPPDELRGRRSGRYSRGEFLKRAGVAGAGFAVAPTALAGRRAASSGARIAIVGGGIAGLNAALTLADAGVASTIYESSSRVGGRMHSDTSGYFANGQVAEYCGELIDTGHTTIKRLARRFGIKKVDLLAAEPAGTTDTYYFLGHPYPVAQADADFDVIRRTVKQQVKAAGYPTTYNSSTPTGRQLDAMSIYEWIETYVPGGHGAPFGRLLDVAYNIEYGAETTDQASLNMLYLLGFQPDASGFAIYGESDERFHLDGGNEQLPQAIANYLGGQTIKLGWAMTSIRKRSDGSISMSFDTPGGSRTVTADHVILTLPFAVLRTLDYSQAGFDSLKKKAITQLGAGRNAKLQLQFTTRLWNAQGSNGNLYSDIGLQSGWDVTRGQDGATGILVDYSGGNIAGGFRPSTPYSNAGTNPQVRAYAQSLLDEFDTLFPGIKKKWNGKASLSAPFLDPNLNLAYSYWRVGQYTSFSGYEGVAQGNVHFAGEHTSQDFQGYMEGGATTGEAAAQEVIAAL
jgi:monoamine oxidase